ncbi:TPA: hypothetical protein ACSPMB_000083 [Pseudomonas aeruginosa]
MTINVEPNLPVELEVFERRVDGMRTVEFGIKASASASVREFYASTERLESGRIYEMSWEQLLVFQEQISSQIATLKPLIESGKITAR